ncbi:hypothetical protein [Aporhodopirellula aestuarii]|uniref:Uncharacterized protein n=1 Tax=Aporhodopirellula aestuarii TaxID=2950107 RepID=A0ABT0U8E7_9BACT|nr:hypothetical protein [Aporhodopirellula aestuarii]MCM2372626.1 hypothetical protein [Aporhodopirellula aestuarii]
MKTWPSSTIVLMTVVLAMGSSRAAAQLSYEQQPIEYSQSKATDPVSVLRQRVESGAVTLAYDAHYGFLVSLLTELEIPVSSQTLVFSKTSLQRHLISPANPRAIYFNDDTYVAWIPGAETIEIASTDALLGTVFYTVDQSQPKMPAQVVRKTERCLFCHASSDTGRVPGLMMQSVFVNRDGDRMFPSDSILPDADGPLEARWAGWFVSGRHGSQSHLGNLMINRGDKVSGEVNHGNGNVVDLSKWFDVSKYLSPHSDLVVLLVLQHQVSMHNLLTESNHRARIMIHRSGKEHQKGGHEASVLSAEDRIVLDQIAERLVDGLLMVGQVELSEPLSGTSEFAEDFSELGPSDRDGRTLRDLDLGQTVFRYPCSYLIYSKTFDELPQSLLDAVYRRLSNVLDGKDSREKYAHLSMQAREDILAILLDTKAEFSSR